MVERPRRGGGAEQQTAQKVIGHLLERWGNTPETRRQQELLSGEIPGSFLEKGLSSKLVKRLRETNQPDTALELVIRFEHQARILFALTPEEQERWRDAINVIPVFFDEKSIIAGKDIYSPQIFLTTRYSLTLG